MVAARHGPGVGVCISDIHLPHHAPAALAVARKLIRAVKPSWLGIVGDLIDWPQFSAFAPEEPQIEQAEAAAAVGRKLLAELRGDVGDKARIFFLRGNHDARPERWCLRHAPQLVQTVALPVILRLKEHGIEYVTGAQRLGELRLVHGDQTLRGWGVKNHAAKMAHVWGHVIYGHTHKPQTCTDETFDGGSRQATGLGCLSLLRAGYTGGPDSPNGWAHGIAVADVPERGAPLVIPVPIYSGRISVPGLGRFAA